MTSWPLRLARRTALVLVACLLPPAVPTPAGAQEFVVDIDADNVVRFISRAPTEEFAGVTDRIDGYVRLDGGGLREVDDPEGSELYFEVDLASLDTGIRRRNRHMRDNYLEVEKYPYATFRGGVDRIRTDGPGRFRVVASGTFGVHGVERPLTVECRVDGAAPPLRVGCAFGLQLSDFDIEIPRIMFLKLSNDIRVELDFYLTAASENGS